MRMHRQTGAMGTVFLQMPRFGFSDSQSLVLGRTNIGDAAEHTRLLSIPAARPDRFSVVINEAAYIKVDEEGTKAEAAAGGGYFKSPTITRLQAMLIDHPFIFIIREERTGLILLIGRVNAPRED